MLPGVGHRPASERPHVPRTEVRVAHCELDRGEGKPKLLGHEEGERRPRALSDLDLPDERPGLPVLAYVDPGAAVGRSSGSPPGGTGLPGREDDHEPVAESVEVRSFVGWKEIKWDYGRRGGHGTAPPAPLDRRDARCTASMIRR